MRSFRSKRFRRVYADLPAQVRKQADEAFRLFKHNSSHPGLEFKRIQPAHLALVSVRVSSNYRAIGLHQPNGDMVWDWIGTHTEYIQLLP